MILFPALFSIKIEQKLYSCSCSNKVMKMRVSENMVTLIVLFCPDNQTAGAERADHIDTQFRHWYVRLHLIEDSFSIA